MLLCAWSWSFLLKDFLQWGHAKPRGETCSDSICRMREDLDANPPKLVQFFQPHLNSLFLFVFLEQGSWQFAKKRWIGDIPASKGLSALRGQDLSISRQQIICRPGVGQRAIYSLTTECRRVCISTDSHLERTFRHCQIRSPRISWELGKAKVCLKWYRRRVYMCKAWERVGGGGTFAHLKMA